MSCISQFSKYVIFILNFLIACCAMALIVFGIMYYMYEERSFNVFSNIGDVFSLGIIAIIVGVVIFFIAAFGCCGAIHENTCLLTIYASILVVLFIIQLVLGILAVLKIIDQDDFRDYVRGVMQDLFDKISADPSSRKTFYDIQKLFSCCGVVDFNNYNITSTGYPSSCCENLVSPCFQPYEIGCAQAFTDTISKYIEVIGYVCIGFAVVEILGAIFSLLVRRENMQNKLKFRESTNKLEETSI